MSAHEQLFGMQDMFNDYSQWQTVDGATHQTIRFVPAEKEGGSLTIKYNAININTGASADRQRMVRYKLINGVASIAGSSNQYTNNDTGMNTADVGVIAQGSEVIVTLTGLANTNIRHTLHIIKLSSALNQ